MSYLDAFLGVTGPPPASVAVPRPRLTSKPNQSANSAPASRAEASNQSSAANKPKPASTANPQASSSAAKRKADSDLANASLKAQRNGTDSKSTRPSILAPSSSVRPAAKPAALPKPDNTSKVVAVKNKSTASSSTKPKMQQSPDATAPQTAPEAPPPKGSFKDIMNRAKAAHEKDKFKIQTPIKHKPTPIISLTELRAQKAARRNKARAAASDIRANGDADSKADLRRSQSLSDIEIYMEKQQKAKQRATKRKQDREAIRAKAKALMLENRRRNPESQSTYKGTMRGPTTSYKSSSSLKSGATKTDRDVASKRTTLGSGKAQSSHGNSYASTSAEDFDSMSDASSDMEADIFDVDKEEQRALKAARLEDAQALKEENDLKRKKMERKRALDELKASRAKNAAR